MGKIIRRTVTITITESGTIVCATEDDPLRQTTTIVQDQPKIQTDALLHAPIIDASEPTLTAPAAAMDAQPNGVTGKSAAVDTNPHHQ